MLNWGVNSIYRFDYSLLILSLSLVTLAGCGQNPDSAPRAVLVGRDVPGLILRGNQRILTVRSRPISGGPQNPAVRRIRMYFALNRARTGPRRMPLRHSSVEVAASRAARRSRRAEVTRLPRRSPNWPAGQPASWRFATGCMRRVRLTPTVFLVRMRIP
jgi:hypothetical protein